MCRRGGVTRRREAGEKGGTRPRALRAGADLDYPQSLPDEKSPVPPSPSRACTHSRARTHARSGPVSVKLEAPSRDSLGRLSTTSGRSEPLQISARSPRVPASVPGIPQDVATRGAVSRGERTGTMPEPRERRRVATVTAARGAERPGTLARYSRSFPARDRPADALLKAERVLCNELNGAAPPFAPPIPLTRQARIISSLDTFVRARARARGASHPLRWRGSAMVDCAE